MVAVDHECVYGVTSSGEEITETLISGNIDCPRYVRNGTAYIGLMQDYLDGRRGLATHYTYCPYCGSKLNWKRIRGVAKDFDIG